MIFAEPGNFALIQNEDEIKLHHMYLSVNPQIPMRSKIATREFYIDKLGFKDLGAVDYDGYLMLGKEQVEIHFFLFKDLIPAENYGQLYIRVNQIDDLYQSFLDKDIPIHPNGKLQTKPWRQKEFSILDPDNNLITFGESI